MNSYPKEPRRRLSDVELKEWLDYHRMALISALQIIAKSSGKFNAQDWGHPENVCAWETLGIVTRRICDSLRTMASQNSAFERKRISEIVLADFEKEHCTQFHYVEGPFDYAFKFFSQHFGHARLGESDSDYLRGIPPQIWQMTIQLPELLKSLSDDFC